MKNVVSDLFLNLGRQVEVCHGCVGIIELFVEHLVAFFNLPNQVKVNSKQDRIEHCISYKNDDDGTDLSFCTRVELDEPDRDSRVVPTKHPLEDKDVVVLFLSELLHWIVKCISPRVPKP